MSKFIALNVYPLDGSNTSTNTILVNIDTISEIHKKHDNSETFIIYKNGTYVFARNNFEDVIELLTK